MKVNLLCCAVNVMIGSLLAEQVRPPGDVVIYEKLTADEDIIMNERVTILWYLDADWLTGLIRTAAENAPKDPRWMRYSAMKDASSRLSVVWDHLIARPQTCDTVVREGPVKDSFEVTTTRAAAETYPTIFGPEKGARIVFGPWWESKRTYPSIINGKPQGTRAFPQPTE